MTGPWPAAGHAKGPRDENFPVASPLIARDLRPHVRAFYGFARAADDIADDPRLAPEAKIARLDAFAAALATAPEEPGGAGFAARPELEPVRALVRTFAARGMKRTTGEDLLAAFRQDALKSRYRSWRELMAYCRLSAAPCGRFLLELHGERGATLRAAADALSAALQVINHIQDCRRDYRDLDRVYLPLEWLRVEGATVEALGLERSSPALERVFARMLDGVDGLLAEARPLPRLLGDRRLALEAGAILGLARGLARRLRRSDPLVVPVRLTRWEFALIAAAGAGRGLLARLRMGDSGAAFLGFP